MFRKILLAVDGSDHSMIAADYAAGMAKAFGATVFLVHAYPHTSDLLGYEDFERLVARRKSAGQAILNKVRKRLEPKDVTILEDLLEGPEAEAILSAAETQQVDLVVMGTRGLGAIEGMVFGSVSRKVTHHAPCPVMLTR